MNAPRLLLAISAIVVSTGFTSLALADDACCADAAPVYHVAQQQPSWIFAPGTYTHDPATGARVAQYMRTPPVEPLDDPRAVTSRYRRTRSVLRGRDGSYDTTYQVQAWGNGRGGIDAEWERFHDAWKESILSGGYYNYNGSVGPWGYGGGYPGYGYGGPGYGYGNPGYGYGWPGAGYGYPPGLNGPPQNGGWQRGDDD